jgi:hypothetical protein
MRKLTASAVVLFAVASLAASGFTAGASRPSNHDHSTTTPSEPRLARQLARARIATAAYATDLQAAKDGGYRIITQMIPDMGYHYLNPSIVDFDVTQPPALVYLHDVDTDTWQLGALEWVFTEQPSKPPFRGATYGSFGAACHYDDGTFVFEDAETDCSATSPETGSPFVFWHPDLVTLHVWLWYPNPAGLFSGTNPLVVPFNEG